MLLQSTRLFAATCIIFPIHSYNVAYITNVQFNFLCSFFVYHRNEGVIKKFIDVNLCVLFFRSMHSERHYTTTNKINVIFFETSG